MGLFCLFWRGWHLFGALGARIVLLVFVITIDNDTLSKLNRTFVFDQDFCLHPLRKLLSIAEHRRQSENLGLLASRYDLGQKQLEGRTSKLVGNHLKLVHDNKPGRF